MLLERFAPPSVIVDGAFQILRSQGKTAPFLELPSGDATLDLLRMVRPGLLVPLRSALHEVRSDGGTVRRDAVEVRNEDARRTVNIEVSRIGAADNPHFLVLFENAEAAAANPSPAPGMSTGNQQTAVEQLQVELSETRADLQAVIQELEAANEELQSANEEILSSNEELQSTNEELDTAREELQATNEELGTVNDELQGRNTELGRANSDLLNLLDSVDVAIVMVTSDLKIRRFTKAAERTLNLIPSDVGRPIGHIKPNIGFPDLESVLRDSVERSITREREVQDSEGRSYHAVIRPYTNLSNRIDGAVLALFNVSESLRVARETGEALMSTVRDPILLLDSNLTVRRANNAFYGVFDVRAEQLEGELLFDLGNSQWDIPVLRNLLEEILPERRNFENFVVEHDFPSIGPKRLLIDGRHIGSGRQGEGVILLILREEQIK
jgi:two-component system, chemotaxis family, CheB/CheR fusion protein